MRVGDWSKEQMNKVEQSGEVPFHAWRCYHGLPRVSGSPEQTVWPRVVVGSANQDHVLGGMYFHQREAAKSESRVERVAHLLPDRFSPKPGRRSVVEPSGGAVACHPEKWLPPLPSYDGSPVVGE